MKYWNIIKEIYNRKIEGDNIYYYQNQDGKIWITDGIVGWLFSKEDGETYSKNECLFDLSKFKEVDRLGDLMKVDGDYETVETQSKYEKDENVIELKSKNRLAYINKKYLKYLNKKDELKLAKVIGCTKSDFVYVFTKGELVGFILPVIIKK